MGEQISFVVLEENHNMRLDVLISLTLTEKSRSSIQKLIEDGFILVNGNETNKNYKVKKNDVITIEAPEPVVLDVIAQDIKLDIVYEDNDLIVVNKPKGMVVHPAMGNPDRTLVNALLFHCKDSLSGINGVMRPGIVHRIDKDTSGLLIIAKNDIAHQSLASQIKEHSFKREYEAIVHGVIKQDSGKIELSIGRHPVDRKKMSVSDKNSKPAITNFEVVNRYKRFTHLKLKLETGRTHQIRVHLSYLGFPIAGDGVYGIKKYITELKGQCLHAKTIGFIHPTTNEYMEFDSELPDYFKGFMSKLDSDRY
jgi:23S rRNA pseudouridine1911/1915/1917 synthase